VLGSTIGAVAGLLIQQSARLSFERRSLATVTSEHLGGKQDDGNVRCSPQATMLRLAVSLLARRPVSPLKHAHAFSHSH
jgi:hypothetical protein